MFFLGDRVVPSSERKWRRKKGRDSMSEREGAVNKAAHWLTPQQLAQLTAARSKVLLPELYKILGIKGASEKLRREKLAKLIGRSERNLTIVLQGKSNLGPQPLGRLQSLIDAKGVSLNVSVMAKPNKETFAQVMKNFEVKAEDATPAPAPKRKRRRRRARKIRVGKKTAVVSPPTRPVRSEVSEKVTKPVAAKDRFQVQAVLTLVIQPDGSSTVDLFSSDGRVQINRIEQFRVQGGKGRMLQIYYDD